jgi:antitoxin (DNA-binding transcriptional repressor) of toxin-antitoxin stability system
MVPIHMYDKQVSNDFAAVLDKVRNGTQIIVEQDQCPVAVISPTSSQRRLLSECIAIAASRGSSVTLDEGFVKDVEEGIASRSQPWTPPSWD